MARWLIEITGEPIDVEEYPMRFPEGDVFAIREGERVFLTGPRFERAGSVDAVRDEAGLVLRELFGVVSLLWPSARQPSIGHVQHEHDDGRRDSYIAVGSAEIRIKAGSVSLGVSAQPEAPQITEAQALHTAALASPHLTEAVRLFSSPRGWAIAYRILEEVGAHLQTTVHKAALASKAERDRFSRTANNAEVGGVTARHALYESQPPGNPMTLDEGYRFVRKMLAAVLRQQ